MNLLEAIILGVIQGLTEFLPVSSSGHLELAKAMFGTSSVGEESMLMTVVLHFATALSTVVVFRNEIGKILKGLFQFKWNDEMQFSVKIIISMMPAAFVGIVFKDEIEQLFGSQVFLVGSMLILTGVLLYLADKAKRTEKPVSFAHSLIIGISQAIAILPGISRSGATISTSVLLGIDREKAARFSFLMVVPLIFGAIAMDTKDYIENRSFEQKSPQERGILLTEELLDEDLIKESETTQMEKVLTDREILWEDYKDQNTPYLQMAKELEKNTRLNLEFEGFSSQRTNKLLTHKLLMPRSLHAPNVLILLAGFITAFLTGLLACTWMISLVKKARLTYFTIYCVVVGISAVIWSLL